MYDPRNISDIDHRINIAEINSPKDIITKFARFLVKVFTNILIILLPLQIVTTALGGCLIAITFGILLYILSVIWWPFLVLLLGTSWLWLKAWYLRPILLFLGVLIAFVAHLFIILMPEPEKDAKYTKLTISDQWPLSWYIMKPPKECIINSIAK